LTPEKTLILASNSPRRKQLLSLGGYQYEILPAEVDETPFPGETPQDYVLRLAESKARAAGERAGGGKIILGSDTTVVDQNEQGEDEILGKPETFAEAVQMLERLRGRTHQVLTAIAVLDSTNGEVHTELCSTDATMRPYSDEEILAYVESGDPMDKAGAYAIQHPEFNPVERLTGCYPNVVGLPLCSVVRVLVSFGVPPASDVTRDCRDGEHTPCRVYIEALQQAQNP
jgi:septum formation protein